MAEYIITTCSTADISNEHMQARSIEYVPFSFYLDGKENFDDLGKTIKSKDFYQMMRDGVDTKTSQPSPEALVTFFEKYLSQGKDVIHLMLSSGISGAMNAGLIAKKELMEKYPERKLYIVDSLGASSGMGLLVDKMADLRDEGMSIDELYSWTEANKLKLHHWFFTTDLTFFVKGGRVSKVAGWFGTVLKICPLLNVDVNGKLIPREKVRGEANVIKRTVEKMKENAENGLEYSGKCYISHANCLENATKVKELILESFKNVKEVLINDIGTTIGSHTGPGTVALFFFGKDRID